ncbi:CHAT domain-containing protein [Gordonia sp. NPDC062954]|uniref:CHAT domain-containing protein n=1 Tax=Gordonia sp. NPDC062954 TaxID=3364003 RepID=UPI0037C817DC
MHDESLTLQIRAVDAGATFVSYRWLDDVDNPVVRRLSSGAIRQITWLLDDALIGDAGADGHRADDVQRALNGPLSTTAREAEFSGNLAAQILGADVSREISARSRRGRVTVRYTPSPSLARVPLDLLPIDGDIRLMEKAQLYCVPPATLRAGRAVVPKRWSQELARRPVLYVIDPEVPAAAGLDQVLPAPLATARSGVDSFVNLLERTPHTDGSVVRRQIMRWKLGEDLRTHPGRMLYFGHVSANRQQPGSASLHLSDGEYHWGLCAVKGRSHRPFSALDLLYGTKYPSMGPADVTIPPSMEDRSGHSLWPMPPRVAIIACEGAVDYRSREIFGLVTACMNSGAELVTTTRWALPSDTVMDDAARETSVPGPTTRLALAVDEAHRAADPVEALNRWQCRQLARWRDTSDLQYSPLIWAAVTDHWCEPLDEDQEVHAQ